MTPETVQVLALIAIAACIARMMIIEACKKKGRRYRGMIAEVKDRLRTIKERMLR